MIEARPAPHVLSAAVPAIALPRLPSVGVPAHVAVLLGLSTGAYALSQIGRASCRERV